MKNLFVLILVLISSFIFSEESVLSMHEEVINQKGDKSFLADKHYFIQHISETSTETTSVFIRDLGFSAYHEEMPYVECQAIEKNHTITFIVRNIFPDGQYINYVLFVMDEKVSVYYDDISLQKYTEQKEITDIITQQQSTFLSLAQIILEDKITFEKWLTFTTKIQSIFRNLVLESSNRAKTTLKTWKMTKTASGNDSIYIDMGKSKILDYTLIITEQSSGVLIARIKATIIGESMLKIYPVQISHYGSSYWIKGNVTIVYE